MLVRCPLPDISLPDIDCSPIPGFQIKAEVHIYPILKPITAWRWDDKFDQLAEHIDLYIEELVRHIDPNACLSGFIYDRIRHFGDTHHIKIVHKIDRQQVHEYEIETAEIDRDRYHSQDMFHGRTFEPERIRITLKSKY